MIGTASPAVGARDGVIRYWYKDFETGRLRWTAGEFRGFTKPTGLLKVRYAIFHRKSGDLLCPEYLLTKETVDMLKGVHS